jgi:excisionase family DNA binding protein
MNDPLLTVAEFADRLGVTERWVRRAIFERRIPFVKLGRLVRVEEHVAAELIDAGRVEAIPDLIGPCIKESP